MRVPIDADLFAFLYTLAFIVFGSLPQLRRNVARIPVQYEIEEIPPSKLSEKQAQYFAPYDQKLAAMNYWPTCTYRVTNYGHNLMRSYVNSAETSRFVAMIVELTTNVTGKQAIGQGRMMSFHTQFTDDRILTTRTMNLKTVMDRPPYQVLQERPHITEPAELKKEHEKLAAVLACPVAPPSTAAGIFKYMKSEHERFCSHQVAQGTLRLQPDGISYAMTDKVFWRGIRNHLNPFANRFSLRQFLPAALVSEILPVVTALKLAPAVAHAAQEFGIPSAAASEATMLACYIAVGALVGYLLERHTFVWVFLLTYIPVRLLAAASLGHVPYSAIAGLIAYSVSQAKKRRRAILIPQITK